MLLRCAGRAGSSTPRRWLPAPRSLQWSGLEAEKSHWWLAGAAVVLGLALVWLGVRALFPAGTLRLRRGLPSVVAFRGVLAGGFFGCEAYVPLMLVEHRGATPTMAGLAVAGTAVGWSSGSWWQGRPNLRTHRSELVRYGAAVAALGIVVTSSAALVTDAVTVPAWVAGLGMIVGGLGMGLSMASNSVLLFTYSEPEAQGVNSAALQMSDALGGLLVIGAVGVVYALWRTTLDFTTLFSLMFAVAFAVTLAAIYVGSRVRGVDGATPELAAEGVSSARV